MPRLNVPLEVREAARKALATKPDEVPEVAYRLASGWAEPDDREMLALWSLDHGPEYKGDRCTVAAALRGGNAGMRWAVTAALGGRSEIVVQQLVSTVRSDHQLTQQVSAAIMVAWDRQIDHSARKARARLTRSTEGRTIDFIGWPNRDAAQFAGIDDLMDRAWDAFVVTMTGVLSEYARTQASIVGVVDSLGADSVLRAVKARIESVINALTGFLDSRARSFIVGEIPYAPQDFAAARTVTAWMSGASGAPVGFAFNELVLGQFSTNLSTAQEALLAATPDALMRMFTWVHSFYGAPLHAFPPHEGIDGESFSAAEVATLTLFPGDHIGCRCELIPDWGPV